METILKLPFIYGREREKKRFFKYTVIVLKTLKATEKSKYNRKPDSIFDLFL